MQSNLWVDVLERFDLAIFPFAGLPFEPCLACHARSQTDIKKGFRANFCYTRNKLWLTIPKMMGTNLGLKAFKEGAVASFNTKNTQMNGDYKEWGNLTRKNEKVE